MTAVTTRARVIAEPARADLDAIVAQEMASVPKILTFADFMQEVRATTRFTFTDIFCGAGGSSVGLSLAGGELVLAANHWQTAIDTHKKNFTAAEHKCADINNYDMRRLPTTDVLWASPICTEISPAGARKRKKVKQLDLFGNEEEVDEDAFVRTRATFHDVIRATEVHRYKVVIVENVTNVASDWELFPWWTEGMKQLGYNMQIVCVNSAHVGGVEAAPQSRDRLYLVFTRIGIRLPDVEPRPLSWCPECEQDVEGVQSWRKDTGRGLRVGKYNQQYDYVCPQVERHPGRRVKVEPYVRPAAAAIDWSKLGTPIGARTRPLKPKTMAKLRSAMEMFSTEPAVVTLTHGGTESRAFPASGAPLPTRTVKIGEGLTVPAGALVPCGGTWRTDPTSLSVPMPTRTTRDNDALAVPPFITMMRNHGGHHLAAEAPLMTMAASGNHHGLGVPPGAELTLPADWTNTLVLPYRKGERPHRVDRPMSTVATHTQHGLVSGAVDLDAVRFRMLSPREQARAQAFPDCYEMTGGPTEQTKQAGNAVSSNVARWLGQQIAEVL
jgi:DNA (cytosine-5)-methyltransferase 1